MWTRKGVTLIELIMVIAILGIIAGIGSALMVYFVQNMVFIPNSLQIKMIASNILDIMCEGDSTVQGLRFSKALLSATRTYLRYRDPNNNVVEFRYNNYSGRIFRRVNSGPWEVVPYYFPNGVTISLLGGRLFRYYDRNDIYIPTPTVLTKIKRIEIRFRIRTGSGLFSQWDAQTKVSTSVYVNTFV